MAMADTIETRAKAGLDALRAGDPATARQAFDDVVAAGRASTRLLLLLAEACMQMGDETAGDQTLDRILVTEPRNIAAMTLKGDRAAARGDDRAAASWYAMVISTAARPDFSQNDTTPFVTRSRVGLASAQTRFEAHLTKTVGDVTAGPRFTEALAILSGRAEPQLQAPTSFYYPGLPQTAFYDPALFHWVGALEAAAPAIRAELDAVLERHVGFRPYVEADPMRPNKGHALLDSDDWSAFHLYENGIPVADNVLHCPATMAALAELPLPKITGRSPMVLFSVLKPDTHIPPHNGMLNTRLIVHLPLIVPENCRLRVGNHTRTVEADRVMVFDDSIEHEAWNDSDATRVVLLFEIWRPELDAAERRALTQMFEGIDKYGA